MKILSTLPCRQFGCVQLQCPDSTMAEMLSIRGNENPDVALTRIRDARAGVNNWTCIHMFVSGAKLHVSADPNHFHIYCYSYDGSDGTEAVIELRMYGALREAARYLRLLKPDYSLKAYLS